MTDVLIAREQLRQGWHPHRPPEALPVGAAYDALNIRTERGTLKVRPARRIADTLPAATGARALATYSHHAVTPSTRLLVDCAGALYATDNEGQTFTAPLQLATLLDTRQHPAFAQMHGSFLMADGNGPVRRWYGGSWISGVYTQVGSGGNAPQIAETSRYTGTAGSTFTVTVTTTGVRNDVTGETVAKFRWEQEGDGSGSGSNVSIAPSTTLTDGVVLEWRRMTYTEGETFRFRCLPKQAVEAFTDRPFPPKVATLDFANAVAQVGDLSRAGTGGEGPSSGWGVDWSVDFLADVSNFNGDASADFTTQNITSLCVRQITDTALLDTGALGLALEVLVPSTIGTYSCWSWLKQRLPAFSLSVYSALEISFQVLAGDQIGLGQSKLYLQLGTADATDKLAYVIPIDLADVSPNQWVTKTVSLADIPQSARADLTHVALAWYCAGVADGDTRLPGATYQPAEDVAYTLLIDKLAPTSGNPLLQPGEYSVTYTYGFYDGATFDESPHASIARIDLTSQDLVATLDITGFIDRAAGLQEADRCYVYVKGPIDADYFRVATYSIANTGERSFRVQWDGSVPADAPILRPFLKAPPAGVTGMLLWRDRMLYIRNDDKLYASNWGTPDKVPQPSDDEPNALLYDEYGVTVRVGQDGGTNRALASLAEYALIFKARSIWLFEGDTPSRFACTPLSQEHGCLYPRTVVTIPERMVIWLDASGDVCGWQYGQPVQKLGEIQPEWGCPVGDLLRALTPAQLSRAFATYHPPTNSYRLTIPGDAANAGVTYIYDLDGKGWWQESDAPNGDAHWLPALATAGLYAVDSASGSLYRLDGGSGAADEATVAYRYATGEISSGDPLQYLIPEWVRVGCQRTSDEDVTIRLWGNNGTGTPDVEETLTPQDRDLVNLRPPLLANCRSVRVGVAGNSAGTTELTFLALDLQPNGRLP